MFYHLRRFGHHCFFYMVVGVQNRAYFNILTAGANDPAVVHFAPAVITFCLRDIKNVVRYFACQGSTINNTKVFV